MISEASKEESIYYISHVIWSELFSKAEALKDLFQEITTYILFILETFC
jgi:hypothetical protein